MHSHVLVSVVSILLFAWNVVAQTSATATVALKPIQTLDCYKSAGNLTKMQEYDFASDGWCQRLCGYQNYPVMAMTAGSICYCGGVIPAADQIVAESHCNSPCNGWNISNCGGFGYYQLYLTGLTNDVTTAPNSTTAAGSSSSSSTPTVTKIGETIVVTSPASSSSGSNKIGIAVGVVVGLVALAGIIGTLIFVMKQRKKKAIEEEHLRLEAQAASIAAEKSDTASTMTDQRLDPSNIFSHRRESIGSIADEMDFSRRILQVRNPDRFSAAPSPA